MATDKYGFALSSWEAGKEEARQILIDCARERRMIPYSDLAPRISSIRVHYDDVRFFHLLGEISSSEDRANRGMLSALVVHKSGDYQPGPGFFELAESLGHEFPDVEKFWIQQVKQVFASWANDSRSA